MPQLGNFLKHTLRGWVHFVLLVLLGAGWKRGEVLKSTTWTRGGCHAEQNAKIDENCAAKQENPFVRHHQTEDSNNMPVVFATCSQINMQTFCLTVSLPKCTNISREPLQHRARGVVTLACIVWDSINCVIFGDATCNEYESCSWGVNRQSFSVCDFRSNDSQHNN